jgi:DNA-binding transcriptional LysR family regulator
MELFSLECFVALARHSKFYEAAEFVHLSQSSFSKHIKALEKDLGARLFARGQNKTELTDAGRALLPEAILITREYERTKNAVNVYAKSAGNRLDIYTHSFLATYGLHDMLLRFQDTHPGVCVDIYEAESTLAVKRLYSDPSTVCIAFADAEKLRETYIQKTLIYDELVLMTNRSHRLAGSGPVGISALRGEKMQLMLEEQEPFVYAFILQQCRKAGFIPEASSHGLWYTTIPELLIKRDWVSIMPATMAEYIKSPQISTTPIDGTDKLAVQIIRSADNASPAAADIFDFASDYFDSAAN